ncbi:hypothetical protein [uncultured Campylobacter sp.]|uniref:hypothetical protein n=1 Tax=uncultured Campylobacter sp. TaxID=218934 RepID=UPI002618AEEE|nr:hypothetical protein [uncultured Campylobacter sp.]
MKRLFWEQGVEAARLLNGEECNLGYNSTGIIIYDEDGEIVGLQSYDNVMFYPANIIKDILGAEGQVWSSLDEFQSDCCFNFYNEFDGWNNATYTKEI